MVAPIFYVDMDDTLCDYQTVYNQCRIDDPKCLYPQSREGFFQELKPLPDAILGIELLAKKYETYILTRPSIKNLHCYTEKARWVHNHLGYEWVNKLIICPDKALLKGKGNWLIDDVEWKNFEGNQLMFKKDSTNWKFIIKLWNL